MDSVTSLVPSVASLDTTESLSFEPSSVASVFAYENENNNVKFFERTLTGHFMILSI